MNVRHGYLYLADLNPRRGTKAGKVRPVVVIQTDYLNEINHPSTWILLCTTRLSGENILRVALPKKIAGNNEDCEVMIDQSRSIDNQRFKREVGKIPTSIFKEIKEKLALLANL
jgi:mRNA interferase MazF